MARTAATIAAAATLVMASTVWAQDGADQDTLNAMSQTVDSIEIEAQQLQSDIQEIDQRLSALEAGLPAPDPDPLPPTMPPLLLSVDDFERSELGSDWVIAGGKVGIVNGSDLGLLAKGRAGFPVWTGSDLGTDHFSEVELSTDWPTDVIVQLFARRRAADLARYTFHYNLNRKTPRWELSHTGGTNVPRRVLASDKTMAGPQPGDTLRLEVSGSNPVSIKGYHNGVLVLETSDGTQARILDGRPGLVYRYAKGSKGSYPAAVAEAWQAGML